jgi:hypothetical protein
MGSAGPNGAHADDHRQAQPILAVDVGQPDVAVHAVGHM